MQSSEARDLFARSLKQWRTRRGFSQEELAERADLHRTYISDVERGARNLSLESINKLAAALEVSLPTLFATEISSDPAQFKAGAKPMISAGAFVNILLVEDNPDDVEIALQAFKRMRFFNPIQIAKDGEAALEVFFGKNGIANELVLGRNQVVLLDLYLPKINGFEVLRRLKADRRTASVPVVLLTASDNSHDMATCQKLGAAAYITKPVNLQGLSKVTPELSLVWALIKPGIGPSA